MDRPPTEAPQESKNAKVLHYIVEGFKDCFLSHWDSRLFEFINSKLVTNFQIQIVDNLITDYSFDTGILTLQLDFVANSEKICECKICNVNSFLCHQRLFWFKQHFYTNTPSHEPVEL